MMHLDWGLGTTEFLEKIQNFRNVSDESATTYLPLFLLFKEIFQWWFAARE